MTARFHASIVYEASYSGPDRLAIGEALRAQHLAPAGEPPSWGIDGQRPPATGLTFAEAFGRTKKYLSANYPGWGEVFVVDASHLVHVGMRDFDLDVPTFVERIAAVPFEVAAFDQMDSGLWGYETDDDAVARYGFGDGHMSIGWGAAFRGAGHDQLVSRRWLEPGPWKLWRGPHDTSLVQLHALDADAKTSLAQASPGAAQIGNSPDSGFLYEPFVYSLDLSGIYEPATQTMKIVVLGRDVPNLELLEWAAVRKFQPRPDRPVKTIAYVFPQEAEARAALPRLWRYEHQCWTIRAGDEVRLDADYQPPDATPSWAR